ncbi:MAG: nucleotidyltransferase domain-containing protein [Chloroflexi bacterium]|nr:nucleotidyltransferase domain-containing protein [Chloroflexota bacterium]
MTQSETSPSVQVPLPLDAIRAFCRRWNVTEFALFGSVLREDFRDDSDIDVLLTYRPGVRLTLKALIAMGDELEALFQRQVDLLDRETVAKSPNILRRRMILDSAQVIYAE